MIWILFIATMALSLWAAARVKAVWTYVAAFITSLVYFLWHLLPLLIGSRSRE